MLLTSVFSREKRVTKQSSGSLILTLPHIIKKIHRGVRELPFYYTQLLQNAVCVTCMCFIRNQR